MYQLNKPHFCSYMCRYGFIKEIMAKYKVGTGSSVFHMQSTDIPVMLVHVSQFV